MSSQSAKYPKIFVKKDESVLSDQTFDLSEIPSWKGDEPILDPKYVGRLQGRPTKEQVKATEQLKKAIAEYGTEINPITGLSRSLSVLVKLEELALRGDVVAGKEFLNRTVGRDQENVNFTVSQLEDKTDEELMAMVNEVITTEAQTPSQDVTV